MSGKDSQEKAELGTGTGDTGRVKQSESTDK